MKAKVTIFIQTEDDLSGVLDEITDLFESGEIESATLDPNAVAEGDAVTVEEVEEAMPSQCACGTCKPCENARYLYTRFGSAWERYDNGMVRALLGEAGRL